MKPIKSIALLLAGCMLLFSTCNPPENQKATITIATAANMQFAMKELTKEFTKTTGIRCETVISSSGKLTAQIKEGAPFDIFASANMKYPNEIFESELTVGPPKIYAYGKLVLWSMIDGLEPSLEMLTDQSTQHIAIANPKTAPYGTAAEEVLKYHGLFKTIENKLVFGESIAQTNRFITSKSAEVGFTGASVVLSPRMKNRGNWVELPRKSYSPIAQGAVVINRKNANTDNAVKFFDFLSSPEAKEILKDFGYSINE